MNILEQIELRLYRWDEDVKRGCDRVGAAQQMAVEILNLVREDMNKSREIK